VPRRVDHMGGQAAHATLHWTSSRKRSQTLAPALLPAAVSDGDSIARDGRLTRERILPRTEMRSGGRGPSMGSRQLITGSHLGGQKWQE